MKYKYFGDMLKLTITVPNKLADRGNISAVLISKFYVPLITTNKDVLADPTMR